MSTKATYRFLEERTDKSAKELFIRGTGVRSSAIWHDRYVSRLSPEQIAKDREVSIEAVYEGLLFCQENWQSVCEEKDSERERLEMQGFFREPEPGLQ